MCRAKHSLGFTLVELLVVISIVIALATIVWTANAGLATRNALQTQQRAFDVLGDAVAAYLEVYSDYPSQPETLPVVMDAFKDEILLRDRIAGDSEVLYDILDSLKESRHLLSRLHTGCVTDLPRSGASNGNSKPEIRDVWGTVLFYQSTTSFPLFISAGPDRRFGTADDVRSK
ncbi:MAG: type II secretion system protein [Planctomycetes bacterium]|nr:type II secretion system protein [Planctomycetota bacterium]